MSKGIGGTARLVSQDEEILIYKYAPYNLNCELYRNKECIFDGTITISKDGLVEPEIHKMIKETPAGATEPIVKRVRKDVNYSILLKEGKIVVENSSFCWNILNNGVGYIAMHIVFKIFNKYQDTGIVPETVSYNV